MNITAKEADKFILENNLGTKDSFVKYLAFRSHGIKTIDSVVIFPATFE